MKGRNVTTIWKYPFPLADRLRDDEGIVINIELSGLSVPGFHWNDENGLMDDVHLVKGDSVDTTGAVEHAVALCGLKVNGRSSRTINAANSARMCWGCLDVVRRSAAANEPGV